MDKLSRGRKTGFDLDGVFAFDLDSDMYKANLQKALDFRDGMSPTPFAPGYDDVDVIITGRPEVDRERTHTWLKRNEIEMPVYFRSDLVPHSSGTVAKHKADKAIELGCTRFVESSLKQAVLIAQFAPDLEVIWFDEGSAIRIKVKPVYL